MSDLLGAAAKHAASYLESLPERPVEAERGPSAVRGALDGVLPEAPVDSRRVLDELVADAKPGVTAMGSARYFGFVIGGALPVAIAARRSGIEVLAQGLNQVLVRPNGPAELSDRLVREIQREGTCWTSATTWRDTRCMRISVCNWRTTFDDVDRSVDAIERALVMAGGQQVSATGR